ncbi:MAG: hypothetical protein L6R39_007464 [Caloplaca ligustica]|nr:MAG: hypothetical protein L6R39_007464 [Caloplaca ligustica]
MARPVARILDVCRHEPTTEFNGDPRAHNPSLPIYRESDVFVVVVLLTTRADENSSAYYQAISTVGVYSEMSRANEVARAYVRDDPVYRGWTVDPLAGHPLAEDNHVPFYYRFAAGRNRRAVVMVTQSKSWQRGS